MAELLWWHRAGQRVVCLAMTPLNRRDDGASPQIGSVYTIRDVMNLRSHVCLRLVEIRNPVGVFAEGCHEPGYGARMFRPVRETSIESLRGLLSPTPDDVRRLSEDVDA